MLEVACRRDVWTTHYACHLTHHRVFTTCVTYTLRVRTIVFERSSISSESFYYHSRTIEPSTFLCRFSDLKISAITHVLVTAAMVFYCSFSRFVIKCALAGTKDNNRERPKHGGKEWTWTGPFARPRPSSTSDEGGSAVPNSRLITAVIWISTAIKRNQEPAAL